MSKDKNKQLEFLTNTSTITADTVTINEIEYDGEEFFTFAPEGNNTITVTAPLSVHGTDVITVSQNDLLELTTNSNGINQGDLFNGWPEDGDPITVTVNKNFDDE